VRSVPRARPDQRQARPPRLLLVRAMARIQATPLVAGGPGIGEEGEEWDEGLRTRSATEGQSSGRLQQRGNGSERASKAASARSDRRDTQQSDGVRVRGAASRTRARLACGDSSASYTGRVARPCQAIQRIPRRSRSLQPGQPARTTYPMCEPDAPPAPHRTRVGRLSEAALRHAGERSPAWRKGAEP
jgi:hypothetical protein